MEEDEDGSRVQRMPVACERNVCPKQVNAYYSELRCRS